MPTSTTLEETRRRRAKFPGGEQVPGVEYDINKRWEQGIPHHLESVRLFKRLEQIDWHHCDDYFCWKHGGDGDNGETLMYELDILFEERDALAKHREENLAGD